MSDQQEAASSGANRPGPPPDEDSVTRSYERFDERYSRAGQARDWLIIFVIGALHFLWMFLVFLYEPGIR